MKSFLTIMGMYRYDSTVFDLFNIPGNFSDMRQNIIDSICLECQELEVLYPSIPTMQIAIGNWSNAMQKIWSKLYDTTLLEYNPIENYDRVEETTENNTGNENENISGNENITEAVEKTDVLSSKTDSKGNGEVINQNVAFNNTDFSNHEKNMTNTDNQITGSEDNTYNTNRTQGIVKSGKNDKSCINDRKLNSRIHGNVGVTTSQHMIEEERRVVMFNITQVIVDDFKQRFCLMVY